MLIYETDPIRLITYQEMRFHWARAIDEMGFVRTNWHDLQLLTASIVYDLRKRERGKRKAGRSGRERGGSLRNRTVNSSSAV